MLEYVTLLFLSIRLRLYYVTSGDTQFLESYENHILKITTPEHNISDTPNFRNVNFWIFKRYTIQKIQTLCGSEFKLYLHFL